MVKLYVEGGGDSEPLQRLCREGFHTFLKNAGFKKFPGIRACGGRQQAYDNFNTAVNRYHETAVLLIDSEAPVSVTSPWQHLAQRNGDGFAKPDGVSDDHCHLMVECMESWFLADKAALAEFFGQGFNGNALPKHTNIEHIAKLDIYKGLAQATAHLKTKSPYGKGSHSFLILGKISPDKVKSASPWAKRFLEKLQELVK